ACMRSNIYELVGESSVLSLVSLLAPLVLGLYWKGANGNGALLAMVLGIITLAFFSFYDVGWPALLPATLVSFLAMIGGSLFLKTKKIV
ncbi:MAG: sodium:solute symporter, partial [Cyclobacteriaceae bacterium]|nr:sodium:solute symporter [Cyclobacteriaceae bacterium]